MEGIKHIIYLMLENRSFDSVLGYLYDSNHPPLKFIPESQSSVFNGLNTGHYSNPDKNNNPVPVRPIQPGQGQQIPTVDPHEDYCNVQQQIANNMGGFYQNFLTAGSSNPAEIMYAFTPESLPVLNKLASEFAVSDAYFSSLASNTDANRAISLTGNSIGTAPDGATDVAMVNTDVSRTIDIPPLPYTRKCIWDVLHENNFNQMEDWMIFYSQLWPGLTIDPGSKCYTQLLIHGLNKNYFNEHFVHMDEFFNILSGEVTRPALPKLPTFSYLEPYWCMDYSHLHLQMGNDYHPPANLACGEAFLKQLVTALQNSEYWNNTLLIINFDEHGGTYDHVYPPENVKTPWADAADGTHPPHQFVKPEGGCIVSDQTFEQLGVRVPLILISPLIEPNTVIRSNTDVPFDHTSVMATILNHFGIDKTTWGLGSRTSNAPTLDTAITRSTPRTDKTALADSAQCDPTGPSDQVAQDLPKSIMRRALADFARRRGMPEEQIAPLLAEHLPDDMTVREMHGHASNIASKISY